MKENFTFLLFILLIIISCNNNNNVVGVTPGNITGFIEIRDEYLKTLSDFSGVNVNIKGKNYNTQSDSKGKWTLKDVLPGVYDIIFSKPGYDTLIIFGFPFPGNGTALVQFLNSYATKPYFPSTNNTQWAIDKTPSYKISLIAFENKFIIDSSYNNYEFLFFKVNTEKYYRLTIFLSLTPDVSKYQYQSYYTDGTGIGRIEFDSVNKVLKEGIFKNWLIHDFKKGDKIYAIAYPGMGAYTMDLRNGFIQWVRLGEPSQVVSFILP
ncbi:MAG: Carboxypeptidase regulatory-like protein [Ignavibacteria bacterium]|nr:Carboxypeptidase regulatory-like protein [Ignavibacteria bacterium]